MSNIYLRTFLKRNLLNLLTICHIQKKNYKGKFHTKVLIKNIPLSNTKCHIFTSWWLNNDNFCKRTTQQTNSSSFRSQTNHEMYYHHPSTVYQSYTHTSSLCGRFRFPTFELSWC